MRRFTKKNDPFDCDNCGKPVPEASSTCRNHCPYCLHSKHVDFNPGDRANPCQGLLQPIGYEQSGKKGLVLIFQCDRCRAVTKNKALLDDKIQPDDYQQILKLSKSFL